MTTLLFTHEACLAHDPGPHHPESPARLEAVLEALAAPAFAKLTRREAPLATPSQIARVHPGDFAEQLLARVPREGYVALDPDTVLSPRSGEAALRAAGAAVAAVDAVIAGEGQNAFCAVRPPGHHAEPRRAMGFCLFNNVAIAAQHACQAHGLKRVAVVDFDVHHGNGTQTAFEHNPRFFYGSTHQMPLYPGTGAASERGVGNIVNAPLRPGAGSEAFREAFAATILPALDAFLPELLIISAGFDAHRDDPLAQLMLVEADYAWCTERLKEIAAQHARGRVVSSLEGGYDLDALAASTAAHVAALMME
ncbi:MAG TPA: histone deacetylase family protein [Stellaceae bacterium]|jgi:acetoin utilization deacetylase AcuC-like enzyme